MRREWTVWLGFTAVVLIAVVFVVSRDDGKDQVSAGTSVPTTTIAPATTVRTVPRTTTSSTPTTSTTEAPDTTPDSTPADTTPTTEDTTPAPTLPPQTIPVITFPPTTPPTIPPQGIQFGPGTYRVNIDLPPGTYRTNGVGADCYWARLSSVTSNPSAADVIATANTFGGPATVTIQVTDAAFRTDGCAVWVSV